VCVSGCRRSASSAASRAACSPKRAYHLSASLYHVGRHACQPTPWLGSRGRLPPWVTIHVAPTTRCWLRRQLTTEHLPEAAVHPAAHCTLPSHHQWPPHLQVPRQRPKVHAAGLPHKVVHCGAAEGAAEVQRLALVGHQQALALGLVAAHSLHGRTSHPEQCSRAAWQDLLGATLACRRWLAALPLLVSGRELVTRAEAPPRGGADDRNHGLPSPQRMRAQCPRSGSSCRGSRHTPAADDNQASRAAGWISRATRPWRI
jgi:hypothetical protein